MADRHHITESKPRTGALPSEQTAKKSSRKNPNSNGMFGMNKLIYELVEGNVQFSNEQFGDNLKFHSETLANVLYDNIYQLIGDKLNEDQIAQYIADQIIQNGGVSQTQSEGGNDTPTQETPVQELDTGNYDALVNKVKQAIDLLNQKKVEIFKELVHLSEQKPASSEEDPSEEIVQTEEIVDEPPKSEDYKTEKIKILSEKISGNRKNVSNYIEGQKKYQDNTQKQIQNVKDRSNDLSKSINQSSSDNQISYVERYKIIKQKMDELANIKTSIKDSWSSDKEETKSKNNKIQKKSKDVLSNKIQSIDGKTTITLNGEFKDGTHTLIVNKGKIDNVIYNKTGTINGAKQGTKLDNKLGKGETKTIGFRTNKPSLIKRVGRKIKGWAKGKLASLKNKVKNSFIGKAFGKAAAIGKKIFAVGKKVFGAMKTAGKAFLMASHFVGKKVVQAGKFVGKKVKNVIKKVKAKGFAKSLTGGVKAIMNFAGAKIVTKLGIKAIKFVGKKIWKGIKKLGLKMLGLLGKLFNLSIKFGNKIGYYVARIGGGIKDKTYRFLVRPISSLMVTMIGFTISMLMLPAQFMKQIIPAIIDRTLDALNGIKQSVLKVLKSTWGVFKKILFNPITIALLIGGLCYFLLPKIWEIATGGVTNFKENILPGILSFTNTIWSVMKGAWNIISTIGGFLIKFVAWLTSPDSFIASAIRFFFKLYLGLKAGIKWLLKMSGKSDIDALCMFLAGDTIGMVIFGIIGAIRGFWKWIKGTKFMRVIIGIVDAIVGYFLMWGKIYLNLFNVCLHPIDSGLIRHPIDTIKKVFKPIPEWIQKVKNIFSGTKDYEVVTVDPVEVSAENRAKTKASIRNLKMKGMNGEKVLNEMDKLAQAQNLNGGKAFIKRLEQVQDLYEQNAKQVENFQEFIEEAWSVGKGNPDTASKAIKSLLESPELSQKLLSSFYYYNPQTGKLMTTVPQAYMGQFLQNIREMVLNDDMDEEEKFKTLIEAFDQMNKERGVIVNKQAEIIQRYADNIKNFDMNDKLAQGKLIVMMKDFNRGIMFNEISASSTFKQIQQGSAKTQDLESVTGSNLGTNKLLKFEPLKNANGDEIEVTDNDMKVEVPKKKDEHREQVENIVLPESVSPKPLPDRFETTSGKTMRERWIEHQETRANMFKKGIAQTEIDKSGFNNLTYDEFLQKYAKEHPPTEKEVQQMQDNKARRLAGLRLAKNIQAYNAQGKVANKDGFNIGKKPSILSIETDGLTQTMLMYSPQWRKVQGASNLSDDELLLELDDQDREAAERVRKAKEEAARKKAEEERERKRQQEILDYSAKVSGGYIEVKIGEDETAMRDAWELHQEKRAKAFKDGVSQEEIDKSGLKNYTWEEWKRYYRKMHGLPEDGIKRIKFEGKRQERKIDWGTRSALSKEELAKYGIQISKDGPVMIPLDKALEASKSIMSEAKTIHSIRDGLEIMKQGLDTETKTLKKKREGGMPFAVVQNEQEQPPTNQPVAPSYESSE